MSLATRCTACGTVFRIVEDQLRVSDGWVRCGRCAEIFDARELLFDIEREAPPPWPSAYSPAPAYEAPEPPPPPPAPLPPPPPPPPPPPAPAPEPEPVWVPPEPEPRIEAQPAAWPQEEPDRREPRWVDDEPADAPPPPPPSPPPAAEAAAMRMAEPAAAAAPEPATVPEFLRRAESSARWNRPAVRFALGALSLLLAALLLLQVTLHFRDALAALHPPLRGPLQSLCGVMGCEVQPWRRIEALSIESTSLSPVGGGSYRLQLSLRNKTPVAVAPPWIELSLTDAQGAPFARRVVGPDALQPALKVVGPDAEQALSFSFGTGGQRVSGYSVNIFHP